MKYSDRTYSNRVPSFWSLPIVNLMIEVLLIFMVESGKTRRYFVVGSDPLNVFLFLNIRVSSPQALVPGPSKLRQQNTPDKRRNFYHGMTA